jgi:hypothetical protein
LIVDAGYFDPYGGASPGPRFFTPALPFLALGLAEAFRRWPYLTGFLALVSIVLVTLDTLTWQGIATIHSEFVPMTIWSRFGLPRSACVGLELAAVVLTAALAGLAFVHARRAALANRRPAAPQSANGSSRAGKRPLRV